MVCVTLSVAVVTGEIVTVILVVKSIVVVSGEHNTLLNGPFLLEKKQVEQPGTFMKLLHRLRKHELFELSVEYPLQYMSWSHSDLQNFSSPPNVLYGYKASEYTTWALYPMASMKKAEIYTIIFLKRKRSGQISSHKFRLILIRCILNYKTRCVFFSN